MDMEEIGSMRVVVCSNQWTGIDRMSSSLLHRPCLSLVTPPSYRNPLPPSRLDDITTFSPTVIPSLLDRYLPPTVIHTVLISPSGRLSLSDPSPPPQHEFTRLLPFGYIYRTPLPIPSVIVNWLSLFLYRVSYCVGLSSLPFSSFFSTLSHTEYID